MRFSLYLFFQLIETTFLVMNRLFIISEIINNISFQCQAENLFQNDFKKIVKKNKKHEKEKTEVSVITGTCFCYRILPEEFNEVICSYRNKCFWMQWQYRVIFQRNEFIVHRLSCTVVALNTVLILAPDNGISAVLEGPQILGFASFVYRTYTNAYLQRSIQICNVIEY